MISKALEIMYPPFDLQMFSRVFPFNFYQKLPGCLPVARLPVSPPARLHVLVSLSLVSRCCCLVWAVYESFRIFIPRGGIRSTDFYIEM